MQVYRVHCTAYAVAECICTLNCDNLLAQVYLEHCTADALAILQIVITCLVGMFI